MNTTNTNNFAPVVEEQIFEQEQNQLHDILNQFKQPIPKGFIELKTEGENYIFSTPTS
jgi:hypothetical protein